MKPYSKILFILGVFLFAISLTTFCQTATETPPPDDDFNLFLLTLALVFTGALIGAAIIGAFLAALVLLFLFSLMVLGVVSSSVAVGLYKRSFSAGFRTFLSIVFSLGCTAINLAGLFLARLLFDISLSPVIIFITGTISGIAAGLFLAWFTYKKMQWIASYFLRKLSIAP